MIVLFFPIFAISAMLSAKEIALTFDDLPCLESYSDLSQVKQINGQIVNCLRKNDLHCVGFVNESKISHRNESKSRTKILYDWVRNGQELGNHTFSHRKLSKISLQEFMQEVSKGEKTAKEAMASQNKSLRYFRYPFLDLGLPKQRHPAQEFLTQRGYRTVGITIDSRDWEFNARYHQARLQSNPREIYAIKVGFLKSLNDQLAQKKQSPKAEILLLHACTLTGDCINEILELLHRQGYKVCTLDRALGKNSSQECPSISGKMRSYSRHR